MHIPHPQWIFFSGTASSSIRPLFSANSNNNKTIGPDISFSDVSQRSIVGTDVFTNPANSFWLLYAFIKPLK